MGLSIQERKFKIDFQDGNCGNLDFWSDDLNYFLSTSHLDDSYQVSSQLAFCFRRRSEKLIFKMDAMATILDFQSEQF